jgi:N-formylglutamate amidohydrolase
MRLADGVAALLENFGRVLVVDCHSFPSRPLPYEIDQSPERPDICLGTDSFHTPPWLTEIAWSEFREAGFCVEINRPFSGALVPARYLNNEPAVSGLMVELNRGLYLNEQTGQRRAGFGDFRGKFLRVLGAIIKGYSERGAAHDGSASAASPLRQSRR